MKKILILLFSLILLTSCLHERGKYRVNYTVIYPDTAITYDSVFLYDLLITNKQYDNYDKLIPQISSFRGTNYIIVGTSTYNRTTCPIRINSYEQIEVEQYRGL